MHPWWMVAEEDKAEQEQKVMMLVVGKSGVILYVDLKFTDGKTSYRRRDQWTHLLIDMRVQWAQLKT